MKLIAQLAESRRIASFAALATFHRVLLLRPASNWSNSPLEWPRVFAFPHFLIFVFSHFRIFVFSRFRRGPRISIFLASVCLRAEKFRTYFAIRSHECFAKELLSSLRPCSCARVAPLCSSLTIFPRCTYHHGGLFVQNRKCELNVRKFSFSHAAAGRELIFFFFCFYVGII